MTAHACPRCGGPGGVLLLDTVAPCDACHGAPALPSHSAGVTQGKRRWVRFHRGSRPPPDCIGWNGYCGGGDAKERADAHFARLPDPNLPLFPREYGGHRVGATTGEGVIDAVKWGPQLDALRDCEGWYLEGEL